MPTGGQHDPRLTSTARRALTARLRSKRLPCALCGQPINYTAPRGHPYSFTADEIISRHAGGDPLDPTNVQPAHWRCNARGGAHITNRIRAARRQPDQPTLIDDDW